jgi:hypothetical protein
MYARIFLANPLAPCFLLVAMAACGSESFQPMPYELAEGAPVRVTVPTGPYAPGTSVPLLVDNESGVDYTWNPCFRGLERRLGATWAQVNENDRVCTAEAWLLQSGDRVETATDVPRFLLTGEYRFVYCFSRLEGDYYVEDCQVSNSFIING